MYDKKVQLLAVLSIKQRFAIISVWRAIARSAVPKAIADTIQKSPLAVCDAHSIAPTDLVAGDLVYRDVCDGLRQRIGETYAVTYNPEHNW